MTTGREWHLKDYKEKSDKAFESIDDKLTDTYGINISKDLDDIFEYIEQLEKRCEQMTSGYITEAIYQREQLDISKNDK